MTRIRVGVLAGGASAERGISLATGYQIAQGLPADRYDVVLLDPLALMANNARLTVEQRAQARALGEHSGAVAALTDRDRRELPAELQRQIERAAEGLRPATSAIVPSSADAPIDVAFIALHGPWGEDGRLQGLLDVLGIPYVGSGVLASALAMDKVMAKQVMRGAGIDVPRDVVMTRATHRADGRAAARGAASLGYPVFVKPVRQGSSFGASIVRDADGLATAIADALRYDDRALVEEGIDARELECAVLGNEDPKASIPGEVVPGHEFYDYDDKYRDDKAKLLIPAPVPPSVAEEAKALSVRTFRACRLSGMARVDFFLERGSGRLLVNEVNTLPGFTAISMYPKLWEASGLPLPRLLDELIRLALERHERRSRLLTKPPAELQ